MSRSELSRLTGINYTTLGLVENGRLFPFDGHVDRIADALEISVKRAWQLMEFEDEG
jgi:transcriptional regulator with XRE-family HTH domain